MRSQDRRKVGQRISLYSDTMIIHEIVQNKGPGFFGERRFNAAPPIQLSEADRWQLAEQQLRQHGIINTEERYMINETYLIMI